MSFLTKLLQIPRFYPAEYALVLISSLILLFAGSSLTYMLVADWLNCTVPSVLADLNVLFTLAVLIVVLPVHLVLYIRVKRADRSKLTTFSLRVASALTALYLFVAAAVVVALTVWLVAQWLNAFMGTDSVDKKLATSTISLIVGIGFFKYGALHFLRVRAGQSRALYYVMTVGVIGLALIVLGFAYPASEYKDAARDFVKDNDLVHLQQAIGEYVDRHEELPDNLQELRDLDGDTSNRLGDYKYMPHGGSTLGIFGYQLCATFATSGHDFGFPTHEKGEQCKSYVTISGNLLEQDLVKNVVNAEADLSKLGGQIANFVQGVEGDLGGQIGGLEHYLEGLEVGTGQLEQEMQRLDTHVTGLTGNTAQLDEDFNDVGKFIRDLLCGLDPNCKP